MGHGFLLPLLQKPLGSLFLLLKVMNLRKEKLPIFSGDYPELDSITLIGEEHKRIYQQLVGMYECMV